ncbi:CCA tRNA nucleotidyltransferase [Candidatus Peregrinibacteria bacterium]|nr:CCA tRNA nucleotidyltransferase [Candidatus Peregrinibacteria bacterium]
MPLSKQITDRTLATPHGEQAYHIVEKLHDAGFDTWWVGGCVRDMLLGLIPEDIDIATDALPEQVQKIFPKTNMTSAALGSVRVTLKGHTFEVTTFREDDAASDGRHPESVVFGKRESDAKRRDITINALYWNPISRELYDPFDGEADLKERLIRFIGDPAVRIKHDALRLMRVVRFRARFAGQYHPETYQALRKLAGLLEGLSGTRKLEEIEKILLGPDPARAFEDLWELGILLHVIPELHACKGIPQPADYHHEGDVWEHTMAVTRAFREDDSLDVRLAALFHDIGKTQTFSLKERIRFDHHATVSADLAEKILGRLQIEKKRREKIAWIIKHHMMMGSFFEMPEERKAHWYFHPWFPDLLAVFYLDIAGTTPADFSLYEKILADYNRFLDSHPRPPKPLLTGDEVMEILGLPPGEEVGKILQGLHDAQIQKKITTKAEARAFLQQSR